MSPNDNDGLSDSLAETAVKKTVRERQAAAEFQEERSRAGVSALDVTLDRQEWFSLLAAARGFDVP